MRKDFSHHRPRIGLYRIVCWPNPADYLWNAVKELLSLVDGGELNPIALIAETRYHSSVAALPH